MTNRQIGHVMCGNICQIEKPKWQATNWNKLREKKMVTRNCGEMLGAIFDDIIKIHNKTRNTFWFSVSFIINPIHCKTRFCQPYSCACSKYSYQLSLQWKSIRLSCYTIKLILIENWKGTKDNYCSWWCCIPWRSHDTIRLTLLDFDSPEAIRMQKDSCLVNSLHISAKL